MTREQQFFLQILSDHIACRATAPCPDLDWSALADISGKHQLDGMVYYQCKAFIPADFAARFSKRYSVELFYYYNREALFRQVAAAFSRENIPFFTAKGMDMAPHYPVPALRTMGDCDLLVHSADKPRVHQIMLDMGFENTLKEDHEWSYFKDNIEFEIHDHLLYGTDFGNDRVYLEQMDRAWEHTSPADGSRFLLDFDYHIQFLLLHLRRHIIHMGAGFRQFLDLSVAAQAFPDADWPAIEREMARTGLLPFARVCFALQQRWFGVPSPLPVPELEEHFFNQATDKIFGNGVFGFDDEENRESSRENRLLHTTGPRWFARLKKLVSAAFPSYRNMRFSPYYAFLDGRPWLLPAAWLCRFYRALRYRMTDNGRRMLENATVSDEKLDRRQRELSEWGLR